MGDTTYHHIYGSNENTADTARQQQLGGVSQQLAPAALEHLFRRADKATDMLRSAIKTKLDSPGTFVWSYDYLPLPIICSPTVNQLCEASPENTCIKQAHRKNTLASCISHCATNSPSAT